MPKFRKKIPQILVLLDSSLGSVHAIQQGVQRYAKLYGPWELHYVTGSGEELAEALSEKKPFSSVTGILARVLSPAASEAVAALKIPIVFIDPPPVIKEKIPAVHRPCFVSLDVADAGRRAAAYLLEKRIPNFAFIPVEPDNGWSHEHFQAFAGELIKKGISVPLYSSISTVSGTAKKTTGQSAETVSAKKRLAHWIQKLPKPVAVFAPSDRRARDVLNACQEARIGVPYEVAVLGVGNDEIFCESCFPPLSSIAVHWQRGGFAAAEILDRLMRKLLKRHQHAIYEPVGVVARDSTDWIMRTGSDSESRMTNDHVIRALEFIRINSGFCVQVEDVARRVGVSRQWLEKRFKADLGHSVLEEIRRHRMERIKSLLVETDLTVNRIAEMSGYENANHLRIVFKQSFQMTMTDYRLRYGQGPKES